MPPIICSGVPEHFGGEFLAALFASPLSVVAALAMPGSMAELALLIAVRKASMSFTTVWSCDAPPFCTQVLTWLLHVFAAGALGAVACGLLLAPGWAVVLGAAGATAAAGFAE